MHEWRVGPDGAPSALSVPMLKTSCAARAARIDVFVFPIIGDFMRSPGRFVG